MAYSTLPNVPNAHVLAQMGVHSVNGGQEITSGNVTKAAESLGIDLEGDVGWTSFHDLLTRLGAIKDDADAIVADPERGGAATSTGAAEGENDGMGGGRPVSTAGGAGCKEA